MTQAKQSAQVPSAGLTLPEGLIPVDDGGIQRAFENLDAQMEAWLAAMKRAERVLASGWTALSTSAARPETAIEAASSPDETARRLTTPAIESVARQVAVQQPEEAAVPPASCSVAAQTQVEDQAEAAPSIDDVVTDSTATDTPEPAKVSSTDQVEAAVQTEAKTPDTPAQVPAIPSREEQRAEDEALLAGLDEATAKAIRVMRRMCMNQKSVRELLAEYEAKKGSAAESGGKKSWFRRGK